MPEPHRSRTAWPSNRRTLVPAFTLIELMIVVAIIAVLIALMLPSLARARQQAYRVRCAANLHQIGMGIFYYTSDRRVSNGHLPNFWGEAAEHFAGNYWPTQIIPYVKIKRSKVGSRNGLLQCPADEDPLYVFITGRYPGRPATRLAKLQADSGQLVGLGTTRRRGVAAQPANGPSPLIEPVSYLGSCERTWDGRRLAEIGKPHCQVLLSEMGDGRADRSRVCFVWHPKMEDDPAVQSALRRHYGGQSATANGSNWLFADLHVAWFSAAQASNRLYCCQEFKRDPNRPAKIPEPCRRYEPPVTRRR